MCYINLDLQEPKISLSPTHPAFRVEICSSRWTRASRYPMPPPEPSSSITLLRIFSRRPSMNTSLIDGNGQRPRILLRTSSRCRFNLAKNSNVPSILIFFSGIDNYLWHTPTLLLSTNLTLAREIASPYNNR